MNNNSVVYRVAHFVADRFYFSKRWLFHQNNVRQLEQMQSLALCHVVGWAIVDFCDIGCFSSSLLPLRPD
jgi:hypothetical protein